MTLVPHECEVCGEAVSWGRRSHRVHEDGCSRSSVGWCRCDGKAHPWCCQECNDPAQTVLFGGAS